MFRQNLTVKQSFDVSIDKINMGLKRTRLKGLCHAYFRQFHDTSDAHHENLKIKHHNTEPLTSVEQHKKLQQSQRNEVLSAFTKH